MKGMKFALWHYVVLSVIIHRFLGRISMFCEQDSIVLLEASLRGKIALTLIIIKIELK